MERLLRLPQAGISHGFWNVRPHVPILRAIAVHKPCRTPRTPTSLRDPRGKCGPHSLGLSIVPTPRQDPIQCVRPAVAIAFASACQVLQVSLREGGFPVDGTPWRCFAAFIIIIWLALSMQPSSFDGRVCLDQGSAISEGVCLSKDLGSDIRSSQARMSVTTDRRSCRGWEPEALGRNAAHELFVCPPDTTIMAILTLSPFSGLC